MAKLGLRGMGDFRETCSFRSVKVGVGVDLRRDMNEAKKTYLDLLGRRGMMNTRRERGILALISLPQWLQPYMQVHSRASRPAFSNQRSLIGPCSSLWLGKIGELISFHGLVE